MNIDWTQAPPWARYAAMDEGGTWYWYTEAPKPYHGMWHAESGGFESFNPCPVHWTQSLTERPTE